MAKPKTLENFATDGVSAEDTGAALQLIASKLVAMDMKDDETAEDGRSFSFFLGAYPTVTKKESLDPPNGEEPDHDP